MEIQLKHERIIGYLVDIMKECRANQRIIGYLIYFLSENKSNVQ